MSAPLCHIEVQRRRTTGYDPPDWRRWEGWQPGEHAVAVQRLALLQAVWPQHRFRIVSMEEDDADHPPASVLP
jgi:hypothetical protein